MENRFKKPIAHKSAVVLEQPSMCLHGLSMCVRRATLLEILPSGRLLVALADGIEIVCGWIDSAGQTAIALGTGDHLLIASDVGSDWHIALGRVGRYRAPEVPTKLTIAATDSVSLKCGEASIDLRADGKVLIKGDDVTVRAKGTKRIRAGTVSIN